MAGDDRSALAEFFIVSATRPWGERHGLTGYALSIPEDYRNIALSGKLYIEHLQTNGRQNDEPPRKNHVVFQVPFAMGFAIVDSGFEVKSARISMDLTEDDNGLDDIDTDRLEEPYNNMELCQSYFPGTVHIKLLRYDGPTTTAFERYMFDQFDFTMLGDFVDFLTAMNLHQMSFLGYGIAWKGCRDFITQTFIQLPRANKISRFDQDGSTFQENICKVWHNKHTFHYKRVDRGRFLDYEHVIPDDFVDIYEYNEA